MINISKTIKGFVDPTIVAMNDYIEFHKTDKLSGVIDPNISSAANSPSIKTEAVERNSYANGYLEFIVDPKDSELRQSSRQLRERVLQKIDAWFPKYLTAVLPETEDTAHNVTAVWIVQQKSGDYASIHNHEPSDFSGITYLRCAEEVNPDTFPNGTMNLIEDNSVHTIVPTPGSIYFWPGNLFHCVYPFRGNGTKTAIAFNIQTAS